MGKESNFIKSRVVVVFIAMNPSRLNKALSTTRYPSHGEVKTGSII